MSDVPVAAETYVIPAEPPPPPPVKEEGEQVEKPVSEVAENTTVDTTASEGFQFLPEVFGLSGEIDPETGLKKKIELDVVLKNKFESVLDSFAAHIEQYEEDRKLSNRPPLPKEHQEFIDLYKSEKEGFFTTGKGWMLAKFVIEQEMALRLAALNEDILLEVKGMKKNDQGEVEMTLYEARGWANNLVKKHGKKALVLLTGGASVGLGFVHPVLSAIPPTILGAVGIAVGREKIAKFIDEAKKHEKITIKLEDYVIDTSLLPPGAQGYLEYLDPKNLDPKETEKFLVAADEALKKFDQALGVELADREEASTWYRRFKVGSTGTAADIAEAREPIASRGMRARDLVLKNIVDEGEGPGGVALDLTNPAHVEWVKYEGQRRLIAHFYKLKIQEINEGKKDEEFFTGSIDILTKRKTHLSSAKGQQEFKEEIEAELTRKRTRLKGYQEEYETNLVGTADKSVKGIEACQRELDSLLKQKPDLENELQEIRTDLRPFIDERIRIKQYIRKRESEVARDKASAGDDQARNRIQELWLIEKQGKDTELASVEANITELNTRKKEIEALVRSEGQLRGTIDSLKKRNDKLIQKDGLIDQVKKEIRKLEEQLATGVSTEVKERIEAINAVSQALGNYGEVEGTLDDPQDFEKYSLEKCTNAEYDTWRVNSLALKPAEIAELKGYLPKGYMEMISLIFNTKKPPEEMFPPEYWQTCMKLFPPDDLAEALMEHFNIQDIIDENSSKTNLQQVFKHLQAHHEEIAIKDWKKAFKSVTALIELKGLML